MFPAATVAAASATHNPVFDWHALAPDLILVATIIIVACAAYLRARMNA